MLSKNPRCEHKNISSVAKVGRHVWKKYIWVFSYSCNIFTFQEAISENINGKKNVFSLFYIDLILEVEYVSVPKRTQFHLESILYYVSEFYSSKIAQQQYLPLTSVLFGKQVTT